MLFNKVSQELSWGQCRCRQPRSRSTHTPWLPGVAPSEPEKLKDCTSEAGVPRVVVKYCEQGEALSFESQGACYREQTSSLQWQRGSVVWRLHSAASVLVQGQLVCPAAVQRNDMISPGCQPAQPQDSKHLKREAANDSAGLDVGEKPCSHQDQVSSQLKADVAHATHMHGMQLGGDRHLSLAPERSTCSMSAAARLCKRTCIVYEHHVACNTLQPTHRVTSRHKHRVTFTWRQAIAQGLSAVTAMQQLIHWSLPGDQQHSSGSVPTGITCSASEVAKQAGTPPSP